MYNFDFFKNINILPEQQQKSLLFLNVNGANEWQFFIQKFGSSFSISNLFTYDWWKLVFTHVQVFEFIFVLLDLILYITFFVVFLNFLMALELYMIKMLAFFNKRNKLNYTCCILLFTINSPQTTILASNIVQVTDLSSTNTTAHSILCISGLIITSAGIFIKTKGGYTNITLYKTWIVEPLSKKLVTFNVLNSSQSYGLSKILLHPNTAAVGACIVPGLVAYAGIDWVLSSIKANHFTVYKSITISNSVTDELTVQKSNDTNKTNLYQDGVKHAELIHKNKRIISSQKATIKQNVKIIKAQSNTIRIQEELIQAQFHQFKTANIAFQKDTTPNLSSISSTKSFVHRIIFKENSRVNSIVDDKLKEITKSKN